MRSNRSVAIAVIAGTTALAGAGITVASALDTSSPTLTPLAGDGDVSTSGPSTSADFITVPPTVAVSAPTTATTPVTVPATAATTPVTSPVTSPATTPATAVTAPSATDVTAPSVPTTIDDDDFGDDDHSGPGRGGHDDDRDDDHSGPGHGGGDDDSDDHGGHGDDD